MINATPLPPIERTRSQNILDSVNARINNYNNLSDESKNIIRCAW